MWQLSKKINSNNKINSNKFKKIQNRLKSCWKGCVMRSQSFLDALLGYPWHPSYPESSGIIRNYPELGGMVGNHMQMATAVANLPRRWFLSTCSYPPTPFLWSALELLWNCSGIALDRRIGFYVANVIVNRWVTNPRLVIPLAAFQFQFFFFN